MRRLLLCCAIVALLAHAYAVASPADLAKKAYSAEQSASFTGVMVNTVFLPGGAESSIVKTQRLRSKSRMDYLSGPLRGTTVLEHGRSVYKLDKASSSITATTTAERPSSLELLLANYRVVDAGAARVAGRRVQALRLEPKQTGNPKVKLWVDSLTNVVLRNERYLYDGRLAARSEYRSIDYTSVPRTSAFALPAGWRRIAASSGAQTMSMDRLKAKVGFALLKPSYVPSGYVLAGSFLQTTGRGMPMAALKYTNGLTTISVFEHRCPGGGQGCGGCGMGRRRAMGMGRGCGQCILRSDPQAQVAQRFVGDLMVVVMGNVSPRMVQKMAESF